MSTFKLCRLWCDHSREMTEEDDSDLDSIGSYAYCSDCGCSFAWARGDGWEPRTEREEECDCDDCKRDFWRLRLPPVRAAIDRDLERRPWRHEGERRRAAWNWMTLVRRDLGPGRTWPPVCDENAGFWDWIGRVCIRTPEPLTPEMEAELDRLADERDALVRELHTARRINTAYAKSTHNPVVEDNLVEQVLKAREEKKQAEQERDSARNELCEETRALTRATNLLGRKPGETAERALERARPIADDLERIIRERDALLEASRLALKPPLDCAWQQADRNECPCLNCRDWREVRDVIASAIAKVRVRHECPIRPRGIP